jgi:flagellar basal body-associated protein FliL
VQFAPPAPDHASPHAGHPDHASPYPDPAHVPPPGSPSAPVWPVTTPPKSRRGALWVSLALVLALLLCGGGGVSAYLLLRNAEGSDGAPDPASAVTRFLTAVYTERNATAAASTVCREARDQEKITAKVNEVKGYSTTYRGPRFAWTNPTVADQQKERALVRVKLTMTTEDEKASEQQLTFTAVKKTGWWVCEVSG